MDKRPNGNKFSPPRAQKTTLAPFSTKIKLKKIVLFLIVIREESRHSAAGCTEGFNDPSADPLRSSGDDHNFAQISEGHDEMMKKKVFF